MAQILPFRGLYYDTSRVELGRVLSPPYDVISTAQQEKLFKRDARNAVRLEFGKEADRYASAASFFHQWRDDGTLIQDTQPSIYLLRQTFKGRDGGWVSRKGFLALCRLEEWERGVILPHEKTFPKPKEDRLMLLSKTHAMFSPIFSIYVDPTKSLENIFAEASKSPPFLTGEFENVRTEVWKLIDEASIRRLRATLEHTAVFIADGHHRYETALEYQRLRMRENVRHRGSEGYNHALMYFANVREEGLVVFPIHRMIRGLQEFQHEKFLSELAEEFEVKNIKSRKEFLVGLRESGKHTFGITLKDRTEYYLMSLREGSRLPHLFSSNIPQELRELDVVLLHAYILPRAMKADLRFSESEVHIEFVKDEDELLSSVRTGEAVVGFLMNPTRIDQLQAVAGRGQTMPQKSTYFYPKLPAGLVMYDLEDS